MLILSALAASLAIQTGAIQTVPTDPDGPVVTASSVGESSDALKTREALAYAATLPRGAPAQDYPLVAWCSALVRGHIALGRSLDAPDDLDRDIMRLGLLEAQDFDSAVQTASPRQTAQMRAAADAAVADAQSRWAPLLAQENEAARSEAFGLFFGLPGRCEHAARRIRENITTPPTTLEQVGLDDTGKPIAP